VFLSEESQREGPLGRAPLLGTLEDMLRKAPHTGISLHRNPFMSEGNQESGVGASILGTSNDEWRRTLGTRHLYPREGSFTGDPKKYAKEVYQET
jgi:hypothetical protein